jgi:hypothetical protein
MKAITASGMNGSLDAREAYWAFVKAFCVFSDKEKMACLARVRLPWMLNTSLDDHIVKHALARNDLDTGGSPATEQDKVIDLEISLNELFSAGCHYASKSSIEAEFKPSSKKANAFDLYVQILLNRVKQGEFDNVITPLPPAKVNAVKERSAGGAGPYVSPEDKSKAAKAQHASCPLDSDCPVHVNRNKEGKLHKWRDCNLYTGKFFGKPNGK